MIAGVGFATFGDYNYTAMGFFLTVLGTVLAAVKTVVTNRVQVGRLKLHPLDLLLRMSPLAFMQTMLYSYATGEFELVQDYIQTKLTWGVLSALGVQLRMAARGIRDVWDRNGALPGLRIFVVIRHVMRRKARRPRRLGRVDAVRMLRHHLQCMVDRRAQRRRVKKGHRRMLGPGFQSHGVPLWDRPLNRCRCRDRWLHAIGGDSVRGFMEWRCHCR